jgi:hypothetical protein
MRRDRNKRTRPLALLLLAPAVLALAGTVSAARDTDRVEVRVGELILRGRGGFRPETLPKHRDAPIMLYGGGKGLDGLG